MELFRGSYNSSHRKMCFNHLKAFRALCLLLFWHFTSHQLLSHSCSRAGSAASAPAPEMGACATAAGWQLSRGSCETSHFRPLSLLETGGLQELWGLDNLHHKGSKRDRVWRRYVPTTCTYTPTRTAAHTSQGVLIPVFLIIRLYFNGL